MGGQRAKTTEAEWKTGGKKKVLWCNHGNGIGFKDPFEFQIKVPLAVNNKLPRDQFSGWRCEKSCLPQSTTDTVLEDQGTNFPDSTFRLLTPINNFKKQWSETLKSYTVQNFRTERLFRDQFLLSHSLLFSVRKWSIVLVEENFPTDTLENRLTKHPHRLGPRKSRALVMNSIWIK